MSVAKRTVRNVSKLHADALKASGEMVLREGLHPIVLEQLDREITDQCAALAAQVTLLRIRLGTSRRSAEAIVKRVRKALGYSYP